jgi:hypothetical protein
VLRTPCDFLQQARLANAWFASHEGHTQAADSGLLKLAPQDGKFVVPSCQGRFLILGSVYHHAFPCSSSPAYESV